ncbi:leucine-rich repeat domain-containing protein [Porphyromonas sp.]|uniref:leucine-rich repeat domain-containing protein n=1 Tax=Porphyromonas sp. TaxID=1924944 RepID=UPI003AB77504
MNKQLRIWLFALLGTLLATSSLLAEGVITMTTTKAVGEKITLEIWGGGITIEGVKEPFSRGSATYTLTSQTVIIRGNVTELKSWKNQLTALDVSQNTALTELGCPENKLTSLDVSGCTALTVLYCNDNKLTSLDVSSCTALRTLDCLNNQLTSLDVSQNTALTTLRCYENQLTMLDVSKNTALTKLECSENQLTNLDVSKNTALTWLNCYHNKLTALDVSQNTALTNLVCQQNQLTALDVSRNTALTKLVCAENKLSALDVSQNTALKIFACGENPLTALDVSQNIALTQLICDRNQLTALDVSQNTALKWLDCCNNKLTMLDVSKNTALRTLECYINQLTALDVSQNIALTELYCQRNQLTALDVSKNTKLEALRCHGNQIKGKETTRLVNSLPDRTGKRAGKFTIVQEPALEGNICLKSDVAIAKGKNWNTLKYKSDTRKYVAYEGANSLKVTLTKEGEGTITAPGVEDLNAVPEGTELTVVATPADGYKLTALTANGTNILATKKFVVTENTEIKATFAKKKNYTVTFTPEGEGTLTATRNGEPFTSGSLAYEGDKIVITAQPAEGYQIDKWLIGKEEIEVPPYTGQKTFECTVGTADVLIKATFTKKTFAVKLTMEGEGTLTATGADDLNAVPYGTELTINATPAEGYKLTALTANGTDILATKKVVIKGATEVKATFADNTGVETTVTQQVKLYPNPATDYVIVEGVAPASEVTLHSMTGERLYAGRADSRGTLQIDLTPYADGVYLVCVAGETYRVVVRR